jgi:hypothetical protein
VHRIIEGLAADTPLYEGGSLEEVLWRLARRILRAALMPMAPSLNRLFLLEADFPPGPRDGQARAHEAPK